MRTKPTYTFNLEFRGDRFNIGIIPLPEDGFDLEIVTKARLSGNTFQALRSYLVEEGYVEAAREFSK